MTSGLRLPGQLIDQLGTRDRRHLDLALAIKGSSRTWVYLSQLPIRIGVPLTLPAVKADAPVPDSPEDWSELRDHAELDTHLLALAHASWLVSASSPGVRYAPAAIAHLSAFLRRRPEHALARELIGYQHQLEAEMTERYRDAA